MVLSKMTISIGDVAKMCGISTKQLRDWEEKGLIPAPERVTCGDRAYRHYDWKLIEKIRGMKEYLDKGYTLRGAAEKAAADERRRN